ncbi:MAG: glycerophosphodiester phosphodiesterase family protein [Eubacteriales bacterium]|nr:glycerophosphodiester phosphodiesterase family protein [Eubacteriales bacterium]
MKQNVSFINYAYRGASAYAPENTLCSFYLGLLQGANGIETDVQLSQDGVPVLFHDDTLKRATGEPGAVGDYPLSELKRMWVRSPACPAAPDRIPTLEDFLLHFADRDVVFAIELKQRGAHDAVFALLDRFSLRGKTILTSFDFDALAAARAACPAYPIGWLANDFGEDELARFHALGGEQLCPRAANLTPEKVESWHTKGYEVRAWGVADEVLMRRALSCGVDGMTVNFPDVLRQALEERT